MESEVRTIDFLGRFVIPKKFRQQLELHEDDTVEITLDNNKLIIKKCEREQYYE
jgi:AbrB family looped-hinge helix DNA binding protein